MDYRSTKHCKYNINYHLVWCTKYRHQILKGNVELFLKSVIQKIYKYYKYTLLKIEVIPDHLHLFLSAKPYISPTEIVKTIKSITVI